VNTIVYTVTDTGVLTLYDPAGNLLDFYAVEAGARVVSIATPLNADDMIVAVLTDTDNLYILRLFISEVHAEEGEKKKKPGAPGLY
jgi:hypothetical protein